LTEPAAHTQRGVKHTRLELTWYAAAIWLRLSCTAWPSDFMAVQRSKVAALALAAEDGAGAAACAGQHTERKKPHAWLVVL